MTDHPGSGASPGVSKNVVANILWGQIGKMVEHGIPESATEVTWKKEFWTYAVRISPEPRKVIGYWYWYSSITVTLDPAGVVGDDNGNETPTFTSVGGTAK